jgi:hypothetical protein
MQGNSFAIAGEAKRRPIYADIHKPVAREPSADVATQDQFCAFEQSEDLTYLAAYLHSCDCLASHVIFSYCAAALEYGHQKQIRQFGQIDSNFEKTDGAEYSLLVSV